MEQQRDADHRKMLGPDMVAQLVGQDSPSGLDSALCLLESHPLAPASMTTLNGRDGVLISLACTCIGSFSSSWTLWIG